MRSRVPDLRIRQSGAGQLNPDGEYVLYWMTAFRRTTWNFSLQRAIDRAIELNRPLLVFEAVRCDYRWASDRLHRFVIQGMIDNARSLESTPVGYFPYVEPHIGAARGLLEALASRSCCVVTDDFPCFFVPRMIDAAGQRLRVPLEVVDSNGILPLRATDRVFLRAHDFRRFLQKALPAHFDQFPLANPIAAATLPVCRGAPAAVTRHWPMSHPSHWLDDPQALQLLPIDHSVTAAEIDGGAVSAERVLQRFISARLHRYQADRSHPDSNAASGLSPFLHFGQISAHQVFSEVMASEEWTTAAVAEKPNGSSADWWGVSPFAEAFLDELITWREVGYNMCRLRDDYDRYESLPNWAQLTLNEHATDLREFVYTPDEFEQSRTHDPVWNAAQRQLVRTGWMHDYLRMLWGKKILEWSESPRLALDIMIELNNKYAVDGRNPNSYSGIFWVLGRYDRAWGPERPIFGKIRYMSSENTVRKLRIRQFLRDYGR